MYFIPICLSQLKAQIGHRAERRADMGVEEHAALLGEDGNVDLASSPATRGPMHHRTPATPR
jgi:hypothetical protein